MIEFNFPFDTKGKEEGKIINFESFRNRLRLYPLYFKFCIENIKLNYGDGLGNINSDESETEFTITFKIEIKKNVKVLFYQKADVFRMINYIPSPYYRGKSIIYKYYKKPGLFKFEVLFPPKRNNC